MNATRTYAAALGAVVKRDLAVYMSYRLRFVSQIAAAAFGTTVFYYVSRLVTGGEFASSDAYFAYSVIGFAVLQVLTATLAVLPLALRHELVAGTFERVLVSPLGAVPALLAMGVVPFLTALATATFTLLFAAGVFGMPVAWSTAPLAVPASLLGALAFLPFAVVITGAVLVLKQAGAGAGLIIASLLVVGGVLYPVAVLPDWIEWTSDVQPLTPAADLLRHLVAGTSIDSEWQAVGRLAAFAGVLLLPSILFLRACLRYGQRRATVLEY